MLPRKLSIGLIPVLVAAMFALTAASASAALRIYNKKPSSGGTALRDVKAAPANQPDAGEFVNNGNIELKTGAGTITCTEQEFGTTVVNNNGTEALKLALPFGVAEADNCSVSGANVPTYFDTTAEGAVGVGASVASITVTEAGGKLVAEFHNLKFSQNIGGNFCTGEVSNKTANVTNGTEPFGEEGSPVAKALKVKFEKASIPISGATCPLAGSNAELTGEYYLETPSTETEGAYIE